MLIIGITGTLGAGKGTAVEYLVEHHGFKHYSVRNYLIQELERRGLPTDRDHLTPLANEIRAKHSPSFIIEELYQQTVAGPEPRRGVIDSIRAVGEVDFLKNNGAYLLGVDAPIEIRYKRITKRGSSTDNVTFEKFKEQEQREINYTDPTKGNLRACLDRADFVINNPGSITDLEQAVEDWWQRVKEKPLGA